MTGKELQLVRRTLRKIAEKEGKTLDEIKRGINTAILVGSFSPEPEAQAFWRNIPSQGEYPTPEEAILFLSLHL